MTRPTSQRAAELLEEAAERSRLSLRDRLERLRTTWLSLVQAALGAGLAWMLAREVVGHPQPFFAPIAAILTLGLAYGERGRRAMQIAGGVTLGIAVADLLVVLIGPGTLQLVVVVLLAMAVAVVLGGQQMVVNQAAVSAVLVVALQPPTVELSFARSLDAAVGCAVALALSFLVLPTDPLALVRREAEPLLHELAAVLEDVAHALERRDAAAAHAALERARAVDAYEQRLAEALAAGQEAAVAAPPRRRARGRLALYAEAAGQLDLAVRNVRVLARGAIRALDVDDNVPPAVPEALRDLAEAVRELGVVLAGSGGDAEHDPTRPAVRAAARATAVLEQTANLSVSVIVGQVRSTAVDLLRSTGMPVEEAQRRVREAARALSD
jgi:uncharacterized membrane protein YgaE (UPF0421/DUF939 family)